MVWFKGLLKTIIKIQNYLASAPVVYFTTNDYRTNECLNEYQEPPTYNSLEINQSSQLTNPEATEIYFGDLPSYNRAILKESNNDVSSNETQIKISSILN